MQQETWTMMFARLYNTSDEEVERFIAAVREAVPSIRRVRRYPVILSVNWFAPPGTEVRFYFSKPVAAKGSEYAAIGEVYAGFVKGEIVEREPGQPAWSA